MKQNNFNDRHQFFFSSPQCGSFTGVLHANCVPRLYFKCFENFIMTQAIECKVYVFTTAVNQFHM